MIRLSFGPSEFYLLSSRGSLLDPGLYIEVLGSRLSGRKASKLGAPHFECEYHEW